MNSKFASGKVRLVALAITVFAHVLLLGLLGNLKFKLDKPAQQEQDAEIFFVKSEPPRSAEAQKVEKTQTPLQADAVTDKVPASMAAPPAPRLRPASVGVRAACPARRSHSGRLHPSPGLL